MPVIKKEERSHQLSTLKKCDPTLIPDPNHQGLELLSPHILRKGVPTPDATSLLQTWKGSLLVMYKSIFAPACSSFSPSTRPNQPEPALFLHSSTDSKDGEMSVPLQTFSLHFEWAPWTGKQKINRLVLFAELPGRTQPLVQWTFPKENSLTAYTSGWSVMALKAIIEKS